MLNRKFTHPLILQALNAEDAEKSTSAHEKMRKAHEKTVFQGFWVPRHYLLLTEFWTESNTEKC